jgi:probable HAF family extracellular repeat protein
MTMFRASYASDPTERMPLPRPRRPRRGPPGKRRPGFRPEFETAEDRCLLSSYNVPIDLGTLGASNLQSSATAINNTTGQVVGSSQIVSGDPNALHPFLWTAGGTDGVPSNPQMKDLGSLPNAVRGHGWAWDINDSGQVVGWGDSSQVDGSGNPITHAFLWQNGSMTDLQITYGGHEDLAINNSGVVVGGELTAAGRVHAFIWDLSHGVRDLNALVPAGLGELGSALINNQGQIVANGNGGTGHAYLLSDTDGDGDYLDGNEVTDLGMLPGATFASASAINDNGQVAGTSGVTSPPYIYDAFVWQSGHMKDIGHLGKNNYSATPFPTGINLGGYVVGMSILNSAWVWTGSGKIQDLNNLIPSNSGWYLDVAWGINDAKTIVGYGTPPSGGSTHAFLLTPTSSSVAALTTSSAGLHDARTPGRVPVEALVLDDFDHPPSVGAKARRTPAVELR